MSAPRGMRLRIVSDGSATIIRDLDTGALLRGARVVRIEERDGKLRAVITVDEVVVDVVASRRKVHRWDSTRLRMAIVEHDLRLAAIGAEIGASESAVSRWAQGTVEPNPATRARLERYLDQLNSKAVIR